jgi:hypothetical protein
MAKKMPDLRNPALRYRDVNRVMNHRFLEVTWEPGVEAKNEWVYASLESKSHRERLLAWLHSKKIPADADAFLFWPGQSRLFTVLWREVLEDPKCFFADRGFRIVSKDIDWALEYQSAFVARFGRRQTQNEPDSKGSASEAARSGTPVERARE